MKFNIIERFPKWLQKNKTYTFVYQIDDNPEKYKIQTLYMGSKIYYFVGESLDQTDWGKDPENRENFLNEIQEWTKGGSYRKTHPIVDSDYEKLKERRKILLNQLDELEMEIEKAKLEEGRKLYDQYITDINKESLDLFQKQLNEGLKLGYSLRKVYYDGFEYLTVYDLKANKFRAEVKLYDDQIDFVELSNDLIKYLVDNRR